MTEINSVTLQELQEAVTEHTNLLKHNWKGRLDFKVSPSHQCFPTEHFQTEDICCFLNGQTKYQRLYFDPQDYPPSPPGIFHMNQQSFECLKRQLQTASAHCGQLIICNGGSRGHKQFCCNGIVNQAKCKAEISRQENRNLDGLRAQSFVNDRLNNQLDGQKKPRKLAPANVMLAAPLFLV